MRREGYGGEIANRFDVSVNTCRDRVQSIAPELLPIVRREPGAIRSCCTKADAVKTRALKAQGRQRELHRLPAAEDQVGQLQRLRCAHGADQSALKPHTRDIVKWAVQGGNRAIFASFACTRQRWSCARSAPARPAFAVHAAGRARQFFRGPSGLGCAMDLRFIDAKSATSARST